MPPFGPQDSPPSAPRIEIRRYTAADLQAVVAVLYSSVRQVGRRDYTREQVAAWAPDEVDWEARARRHGSRPTWVAESAARVVGFADLEPSGHIDFLYVHADHQGRGVATALLLTIERTAREGGIERLFAEASLTARPFFERRGFHVTAEQRVEIRGQKLTNFRMERFLRPILA